MFQRILSCYVLVPLLLPVHVFITTYQDVFSKVNNDPSIIVITLNNFCGHHIHIFHFPKIYFTEGYIPLKGLVASKTALNGASVPMPQDTWTPCWYYC
jgi:hypothetical protein